MLDSDEFSWIMNHIDFRGRQMTGFSYEVDADLDHACIRVYVNSSNLYRYKCIGTNVQACTHVIEAKIVFEVLQLNVLKEVALITIYWDYLKFLHEIFTFCFLFTM